MKRNKFGVVISMSSDDPIITDALDRLERQMLAAIQRCFCPQDVMSLLRELIVSSQGWCNQPRVDRTRWLHK